MSERFYATTDTLHMLLQSSLTATTRASAPSTRRLSTARPWPSSRLTVRRITSRCLRLVSPSPLGHIAAPADSRLCAVRAAILEERNAARRRAATKAYAPWITKAMTYVLDPAQDDAHVEMCAEQWLPATLEWLQACQATPLDQPPPLYENFTQAEPITIDNARRDLKVAYWTTLGGSEEEGGNPILKKMADGNGQRANAIAIVYGGTAIGKAGELGRNQLYEVSVRVGRPSSRSR